MIALGMIVGVGAIIFWVYQLIDMITEKSREEAKSKREATASRCLKGDHSFSVTENSEGGMCEIKCVNCGYQNLIPSDIVR